MAQGDQYRRWRPSRVEAADGGPEPDEAGLAQLGEVEGAHVGGGVIEDGAEVAGDVLEEALEDVEAVEEGVGAVVGEGAAVEGEEDGGGGRACFLEAKLAALGEL